MLDFCHQTLYWRVNLEFPVLFSEALAKIVDLEDASIQGLVEVGTHPAPKLLLQEILKVGSKTFGYVPKLTRKEDSRKSMLQLAGTLFSLNSIIDLVAVDAVDEMDGTALEHGCTGTALPPYQYTYGEMDYHESRLSKDCQFRSVLRHDLLRSKVVENAKLRPAWLNVLRVKDVPRLSDHRSVPGEWSSSFQYAKAY